MCYPSHMHLLRLHSNFLQLRLRRKPPSKMDATSWSPKGMTDAPFPASYTPTAKFKSLPFRLLKQCRPASNKYGSKYIPPVRQLSSKQIFKVVALLQEAHALSSAAAPVILDCVPAEPLVCVQVPFKFCVLGDFRECVPVCACVRLHRDVICLLTFPSRLS